MFFSYSRTFQDYDLSRKIPLLPQPFDRHRKIGVRGTGWAPQVVFLDTLRALNFEKYIVGSYVCKRILLVGSDGFRLHFFNVGKILIWYMAVLSLILFSIVFFVSVCIYCCSSFQILMVGKFTCWLVPFIWMRLYPDSNVLLVALCISRFVCALHQGFSVQPLVTSYHCWCSRFECWVIQLFNRDLWVTCVPHFRLVQRIKPLSCRRLSCSVCDMIVT